VKLAGPPVTPPLVPPLLLQPAIHTAQAANTGLDNAPRNSLLSIE
jgi:hypothetical protein